MPLRLSNTFFIRKLTHRKLVPANKNKAILPPTLHSPDLQLGEMQLDHGGMRHDIRRHRNRGGLRVEYGTRPQSLMGPGGGMNNWEALFTLLASLSSVMRGKQYPLHGVQVLVGFRPPH